MFESALFSQRGKRISLSQKMEFLNEAIIGIGEATFTRMCGTFGKPHGNRLVDMMFEILPE